MSQSAMHADLLLCMRRLFSFLHFGLVLVVYIDVSDGQKKDLLKSTYASQEAI